MYWAYYNTETGCSYIYNGSEWNLLAKAGKDGKDGTSGGGNSGGNGGNSGGGSTSGTTTMFMGFDSVVTIANGTNMTEITNAIYSLTSDTTLKFTGGINSITLTTVAAAMQTNDSVKIALDFSETTGITAWPNKLAGLTTLYAISLPNTVTSVQDDAFENCSNLKAITVPCSIESYPSVNSDSTIVNFAGTLADWLNGSVVIPFSGNGVTQGHTAQPLYLNGAEVSGTVTIPDSVTTIRSNAFADCPKITSIVIPDSVTSIGDSAFYGCSGLTGVSIGTGVTSIGESAFSWCSGLTGITIPVSVTSIGAYAFYGCSGLTSVNYEGTIGQWLQISYNLPSNPRYMDTTLYCTANPLYYAHHLYIGGSEVTNLSIPSGVTSIGKYVFAGGSGLTSVTIPSSVTSIGNHAFSGCSEFTSVSYEGSIEQWLQISFSSLDSNPLYYAHHLYIGGSEVMDLNIPDDVTGIREYAFSGCSRLKSVTISNSVTSIGKFAFSGCSGLTSITIPNSVTRIGNAVFNECTALRELIIQDGQEILTLGWHATESVYASAPAAGGGSEAAQPAADGMGLFYDCPLETVYLGRNLSYESNSYASDSPFANKTTLVSVQIGNSVTYIKDYMFYGCNALTTVNYRGSEEQWWAISFGNYNEPLMNATIVYNYTGD